MTNLKPFKYVELFAGIGGFRQALDKLGGECVLASEIDKYASQAYRILYNGAMELHGDVTKIEAEDVPDHEVLVGGFPCQAFSVAGKRLGFEDTRGTLFFEAMRIASEKKPKVLVMENVKGLISHDKGNTLDTMILAMNEVGYTVDFEVLNSKYFGVPQNRERIFIIGVRDDLVTPSAWNIGKRTDIVSKGKRRINAIEGVKMFNFNWPSQYAVTTRLRDVLESYVDEKYYLSEEKTNKLVEQLENKERSSDETSPEKLAGLWGAKQAGSMYDVNKIAPTLKTSSGGYSEPLIEDNPPTIFDVSQARGEGKARIYTEVAPTLAARDYKEPRMVGQIEVLGKLEMKGHRSTREVHGIDGISPTLTTMGGGHREPKIAESGSKYRIRKLTPKECFALQGFPLEDFDKLTANGISNSQLYKMAGNAVTVNVIDAIGKRLLPYLN